MESSCVPAFPITSGNTVVGVVLHPVPVDLREVGKLCEIEKSCICTDFEGVCETRWIPIPGFRPADPEPSASGTLRVTTAAGIKEESPRSLKKLHLSYPNWELLGPAVVIRRRPKRVKRLDIS